MNFNFAAKKSASVTIFVFMLSLAVFLNIVSIIPIPIQAAGTESSPIAIDISTVNANGPGYLLIGTNLSIAEDGHYLISGTTTDKKLTIISRNSDFAGIFVSRNAY